MKAFKQIILQSAAVIIFAVGGYGYSQAVPKQKLKEKVAANGQLFQKNLDEAYFEIGPLLKDAIAQKDSLSELILLDRKCRYFFQKNQVDSLIKTSERLQYKAGSYNNLYTKAMANIYLAEAYSINALHERALSSLEVAYEILEKEKEQNKRVFFAKANVLTSFANVYLNKGEPEKAVEKLQQVIKSYDALANPDEVKRFQYLNYSNIANAYLAFDLKFAEYYALRSIALKPENVEDDKVMMMNFYTLGKVNMDRKAHEVALEYYHKALEVNERSGEEHQIKQIYTDLIALYNETGENDKALLYENKLKEFEISILQSKYNSLWDVIDKTKQGNEEEKKPAGWLYIVIGSILLAVIVLLFIFFRKRKNTNENMQEQYNALMELIKNNDPAFMFAFEKVYPDFSEKLLAINPKLSKSEIEFCALLKLNLSTKKIAKLTFIETRTVQNKKHRIRKRLNIPQAADIYNWFNSI